MTSSRLNQIIAVEKGEKARVHTHLTGEYQRLSKAPLFAGQNRTYQPFDEEGMQLPPESQKVQVNTEQVLSGLAERLTGLFDITATKDFANCIAKADVVVDGTTLLASVPATFLLFLEKQLVDIRTFVSKLPVLDPSEEWQHDPNTGHYRTRPVETFRTQKVPRNHVKAEATDKHPAQVETYFEDVPVGKWQTVRLSGALPATRVEELASRVEKLQAAVKHAREEANMVEAPRQEVGEAVFSYLFS
jgi:hypothetical protein